MSNGRMTVHATNIRIASPVTFIPGTEPKKNHAIVTAICNLGMNKTTQKEMSTDVTLNFWGSYADVAANYLEPGKQINVMGRLQSYTTDTGRLNAKGKKILDRKMEIVVDHMELLGDSLKTINKRIADNLAILKAAGTVPATLILTAEQLLKNTESTALVPFNAALSAVTGKHGKANVWDKTRGFWSESLGSVAPAAAPANIAAVAAELQRMQTLLASMQAAGASTVVPAAVEAPVPVMEMSAEDAASGDALFGDAE